MGNASRIRKDGGLDRRFKNKSSKGGCGCMVAIIAISASMLLTAFALI